LPFVSVWPASSPGPGAGTGLQLRLIVQVPLIEANSVVDLDEQWWATGTNVT
jgi:hypothetical protein